MEVANLRISYFHFLSLTNLPIREIYQQSKIFFLILFGSYTKRELNTKFEL